MRQFIILVLVCSLICTDSIIAQTAVDYYNRGIAKDEANDFNGAIKEYSKAIELNSKHINAYYNRGLAKEALTDYKGAIRDFNKVIELNPNEQGAYFHLGFSKFNLKDYKGAIENYTIAIKLDPNDADAYVNRGKAKLLLGHKNDACIDILKGIQLGYSGIERNEMIDYCK